MKSLPHDGVYTRIKPSKIHGVGVFAIRDIPRGAYVFADDEAELVWVNKSDIKGIASALRDLYDDFAIIKNDKYGSPRNFDLLTTSWYLNHSDNPNVAADKHYRFYALRDIKEGEELTANYRTYSETP